jgi:hypothetical protein
MQNGKDDRTKGQKRVTEKNGKEETTKEKPKSKTQRGIYEGKQRNN